MKSCPPFCWSIRQELSRRRGLPRATIIFGIGATNGVIQRRPGSGSPGVLYATTGLPLTLVASAPVAGQYSVASGVYTFNSADAGKAILATYTYTVSGTGQKFTVANQLLGTTPTFQAVFYTTFQSQAISLKLNNCTSNKLSFQTKLEDFIMPEFDFSCFADAAGNVMTWSFAEVS